MSERKTEPYTTQEQAIIDGLKECQAKLGLSDEQFCALHLKSYGRSTWSKLRDGKYGAADRTKTMRGLKSALASIRLHIKKKIKVTQDSVYHELELFQAMFQAVEECLAKPGQNRLVMYIAPTGWGKSRFITELGARHEVVARAANKTWERSYFFANSDILKAMGVTMEFSASRPNQAREELLEQMDARVKVLAIDEGNYFGPASLDLMKDLLNETEWALFIAMTPDSFKRMQKSYNEWSQLQRRVHKVFIAGSQYLTSAEVEEFLADLGLNGSLKPAAKALAKEANEFGGFDFIDRTVKRLRTGAEESGDKPALEEVKAAIDFVNAELGRVLEAK